ncbi:MAG: 1-hydroxycarotenoid 3,4-desaturase CrtD [Mucilaginibacter sp.]
MPKALIIGAGIAGIAAAIRLAVKGYEVEVFEANAYPGGKLSEIRQNEYRFDAGPSLLTMPQYIDELFTLAGRDTQEYFKYQKLDIVCKYFYDDGTVLNAYADEQRFVNELASATGEPAENIVRCIENSANIYNITHKVFLERPLQGLKNYLNTEALNALFRLPQIDTNRSMHMANESFFKNKRLVQFFDRYATYNGSHPYRAPATLNVIPYLEQHFGAYFPEGGMYNIVKSLVKLAEELGVKFHYNSPVQEIILDKKRVNGIKVNNEIINGDVVISNIDVWFTYKKLLTGSAGLYPKKTLNQERSSSALIFYWGIKKQFPQLDLHNIFFSKDYKTEFEHIWQHHSIYHDPTVYLNISSKYKADDAPESCENWFVMINVPSNQGQDWDGLITEARQNILQKLSAVLNENIAELIESESILDPRSIESKTSSYQGSIYGTSSNSRFAAFLRHANRSSKIGNLYFCGGSVHPGGGIPLCLLSAKIVSSLTP